jgi:hypothetical protein
VISRARIFVAAFYAVLAISCLSPLASDTVLPVDGQHVAHAGAIVQARAALNQGQFPIRIAPWQHQGWQYPYFQFVSPLPYTVAAIDYHWIAHWNPFLAYKQMLWFASVLGAFFVYLTAERLLHCRKSALLAGAAYMTMPYLLSITYAQGAFSQAMGAGMMPVVLYAALRVHESATRASWIFVAAIAWGLLALTDYVTWLWASLLCGSLFLALAMRVPGTRRGLLRVSVAWLHGLALVIFFVAPIESVRGSLHSEALWSLITRDSTVPLSTLLAPIPLPTEPQVGSFSSAQVAASVNTWPLSDFSAGTRTPTVGWPVLMALGIVGWAFWRRAGIDDVIRPESRRLGTVIAALCLLAIVLAWLVASDRFLIPVIWSGALLIAYALVLVSRGTLGLPETVGGLLVLAIIHGSFLPMLRSTPITTDVINQNPDLHALAETCLLVPFSRARATPAAAVGSAAVCSGQPAGLICHTSVPGTEADVQLPMLFYPDLLEVTLDGREVPYAGTRRDRVLLTSVRVPSGTHDVSVRFRGLRWADSISVIAWLATAAGFVVSLFWSPGARR